MKKFFLSVAFASALLLSCGDDDQPIVITEQPTETPGETVNATLTGEINEDLTLTADTIWELDGRVTVTASNTLTIEPGTIIKAFAGQEANASVLVIARGAKIEANGTAAAPIIMTSAADGITTGQTVGTLDENTRGLWGGLIVLGRAPISEDGDIEATQIEGIPADDTNGLYGGTDAADDSGTDDSGTISYVSIRHGGTLIGEGNEINGLTLGGVGTGTTVNHVEVVGNVDDGVEFFGGTVNASFISVVGAQDDSVDWTEGFTGTLTNVYIEHRQSHDKGIEGDGFNTDIGNNSNPVFWSAPTVTNLTINGLGSSNENEAIRLRAGTRAIFTNVLLEGFAEGFDLDDNETGNGVLSDETSVTDITFDDITLTLKNDTGATFGEADVITGVGNGTGADYNSWNSGWTRN